MMPAERPTICVKKRMTFADRQTSVSIRYRILRESSYVILTFDFPCWKSDDFSTSPPLRVEIYFGSTAGQKLRGCVVDFRLSAHVCGQGGFLAAELEFIAATENDGLDVQPASGSNKRTKL